MIAILRRWLIAGLLVWIPLAATLLLIRFIVGLLDTSLLLLPESWAVPGLGVLLSLALVLATGALAANYLGSQAVRVVEIALGRIPLVSGVYGGMKKLAQTVLSNSSRSFRQAALVEYPRPGCWTIAFLTAEPAGELRDKLGADMVSCFVPTTPNPTSGFLLLVPRSQLKLLDMPVAQAMRLVISLGVVAPDERLGRRAEPMLPPPTG